MVRERNRRAWWKLADRDVPKEMQACLLGASALSIKPPSLDMPIPIKSSYYIEFLQTTPSAAYLCDFIDGQKARVELGL